MSDPNAPPWRVASPCPPPLSLAWRMGPSEAYFEAWLERLAALDAAALEAYLRDEQAPEVWRSWVVGVMARR